MIWLQKFDDYLRYISLFTSLEERVPRDSADERPERVTETNERLGVTVTNERLG